MICSFCGKSQREVRKLIAGPSVYICDECIGLCVKMCNEDINPPVPALRTAGGRQIPDLAWCDIAPDAAEVVVNRLLDEVDTLERFINAAQARSLAAHSTRVLVRLRDIHSALRELGFAEQIRARCLDDYLEALPAWSEIEPIGRDFVCALLLRRIPGLAGEVETATVHGLGAYADHHLEVAAAYRAAAVALGWGASTVTLAS